MEGWGRGWAEGETVPGSWSRRPRLPDRPGLALQSCPNLGQGSGPLQCPPTSPGVRAAPGLSARAQPAEGAGRVGCLGLRGIWGLMEAAASTVQKWAGQAPALRPPASRLLLGEAAAQGYSPEALPDAVT